MNGKTHDRAIEAIALATATTCSAYVLHNGNLAIAASGLTFAVALTLQGQWLSPDLDGRFSNSLKRWKTLRLGWWWKPYDKALKHRSFWSHAPAVGDGLRIAYGLPAIAAAPIAIAVFDVPVSGRSLVFSAAAVALGWQHPDWLVVSAIAGILTAGLIHWALDGCPSFR